MPEKLSLKQIKGIPLRNSRSRRHTKFENGRLARRLEIFRQALQNTLSLGQSHWELQGVLNRS